MSDGGTLFLFAAIVAGAFAFRIFVSGPSNRLRIEEAVRRRGGEAYSVERCSRASDKNESGYEVHYRDRDGQRHRAVCKTSMWTGVYWGEDEVIDPQPIRRSEPIAEPLPDVSSVIADEPGEELGRLRAENARLRGELDAERRRRT